MIDNFIENKWSEWTEKQKKNDNDRFVRENIKDKQGAKNGSNNR